MNPPTTPTSSSVRQDALLDLAALEALNGPALGPEDLLRLDPVYAEARLAFDETAASLAFTAGEVDPPPGLFERLLAAVSVEAQETPPPDGYFEVKPGVTAVRTSEAPWQAAPIEGAEFKVISRDADRHYTTRLVRFAPGTSYPTHRHGGTEEIFVLEGSVLVNGVLLKAGDYCRSEAGTDETGTISHEGAMAIVVSSDFDEIAS